jgi:hypothetical protein
MKTNLMLLVGATLAAVTLIVVSMLALLEPKPTFPTPPGQTSPECTEEDLADGSCYTYQDFHDSEWSTD